MTHVTTSHITSRLVSIVLSLSPATLQYFQKEDISRLIPDTQYRHAVLKLLRNIVPDGRRVSELEFTIINDEELGRASLFYGSKANIERSLRSDNMDEPHDNKLSGVLRALHLDRNWLEISTANGTNHHCVIEHAVLDDVVGPMVNQPVIVSGRWEGAPARSRFRLFDIELDSSQADEQVNDNPS